MVSLRLNGILGDVYHEVVVVKTIDCNQNSYLSLHMQDTTAYLLRGIDGELFSNKQATHTKNNINDSLRDENGCVNDLFVFFCHKSGWDGSEEWIRAQFKLYLLSLLSTIQHTGGS